MTYKIYQDQRFHIKEGNYKFVILRGKKAIFSITHGGETEKVIGSEDNKYYLFLIREDRNIFKCVFETNNKSDILIKFPELI